MLAPSLTLRPAAPSDEPFLAELYATTRAGEIAAFGWTEQERTVFCMQQFTAQSRHYATYYPDAEHSIVLAGEGAVGRLYVDRAADELRVVDIALLPEHRGAGIGTTLVRRLIAEAGDRGVPVRLHVLKVSPALRLYERLGFVAVADAGAYWALEGGVDVEGDNDE